MMTLLGGLLAVALSLQAATAPHYRIDCDAAAHYSEGARGVAFLVVQGGQVVCERYARGTGPDDAWDLASGTKSLTAMMAAIAVQDGLFTLDTPVADIVGDADIPPGLTVRTLLHQSSGLAVPRTVRRIPAYEDALRTRVEFPPGERFVYGPVHFEAFGAVLQHALDARGMDANPGEYLVRRILAPVGGRIESWRAVDGAPALSEGARMTARDWARFGLVAVREGRVGTQLLADAQTVRAMFEPATPTVPTGSAGGCPVRPAMPAVPSGPTGCRPRSGTRIFLSWRWPRGLAASACTCFRSSIWSSCA